MKDLASGQTLQQSYLPIDMYHQALTLLRRLSTPLVYIDAFHENVDILTESMERAHPFQRAYLTDQLAHCRIVDDIASPLSHGVVLLCIMADCPACRHSGCGGTGPGDAWTGAPPDEQKLPGYILKTPDRGIKMAGRAAPCGPAEYRSRGNHRRGG